ncbi:hypothetical protein ACWGS5_13625 [Streptomyces albidoflavus]|uniref:hypothetical protein n=1 Tax=unclassified Streptomyces TaxID=2593676 RepID=UPI001EE3D809|nr:MULTISPECIES: hypothetical protein [unclassified Streptomyces]MCG5121607.1 hypothetical protein [Streptomyces sp. T7(2022)]MCK2145314.1 hypothetical protein [Streptomyces sp. WAC00276]
MAAQTKAERTAANRLAHYQDRQAERAARGARGLTESWMEECRAIAVRYEQAARAAGKDPDAAWHDLSRTLSVWADRYSE